MSARLCKLCDKEIRGNNHITAQFLTILHYRTKHKGINISEVRRFQRRFIHTLLMTPVVYLLIGIYYILHPAYLLHEKIDNMDNPLNKKTILTYMDRRTQP